MTPRLFLICNSISYIKKTWVEKREMSQCTEKKNRGTGFLFSAWLFLQFNLFFFTFKSKSCLASSSDFAWISFCERSSPINNHVLRGWVTKPTEKPPCVLARCGMGTDHVLNHVLMPYSWFKIIRFFGNRAKFSWSVGILYATFYIFRCIVYSASFFQFWVC